MTRTRDTLELVEQKSEQKPIGVRTRVDVTLSERCGLIVVPAHQIVRDSDIIAKLRAAGVKLDNVYDE